MHGVEAIGNRVAIAATRATTAKHIQFCAISGGGGVITTVRHCGAFRPGVGVGIVASQPIGGRATNNAARHIHLAADQRRRTRTARPRHIRAQAPRVAGGIEDLHFATARAQAAKQVQLATNNFGSVMMAGEGSHRQRRRAAPGIAPQIIRQRRGITFANNIRCIANDATGYFTQCNRQIGGGFPRIWPASRPRCRGLGITAAG